MKETTRQGDAKRRKETQSVECSREEEEEDEDEGCRRRSREWKQQVDFKVRCVAPSVGGARDSAAHPENGRLLLAASLTLLALQRPASRPPGCCVP